MCTHTHDHQTMVTETSKTTNFWARFLYIQHAFIFSINSLYWYSIFLLARFLQGVKETKEITALVAHFF